MPSWKIALGVAAAALVLGAGVWWSSSTAPTGPVPMVWDKTACAGCRMHIGEPAFAAQLQTTDGQVLDFDDPGCLFEYVERARPSVHAIYFHHLEQDRWLGRDEVGFIRHPRTPMGHGWAAVERTRPGAVGYDEALKATTDRAIGRMP